RAGAGEAISLFFQRRRLLRSLRSLAMTPFLGFFNTLLKDFNGMAGVPTGSDSELDGGWDFSGGAGRLPVRPPGS
ncbi:MAG: hypothetical protein JW929_13440, partial [Anaerolineales bacterium]|nr:hypothetical protein [Anaerolineales bacterium]